MRRAQHDREGWSYTELQGSRGRGKLERELVAAPGVEVGQAAGREGRAAGGELGKKTEISITIEKTEVIITIDKTEVSITIEKTEVSITIKKGEVSIRIMSCHL